MGPSGSGKSTLMHCLAGLDSVTSSLRCGVAWNTLFLAVLVGIGTTALGLAFALIATRTNMRLKGTLRVLSILPIITPPFVIGLANIGQAVPSIGVLALLAIIWSIGFWPCIVALVAYSFLSILRNTMVGLQQVDRSTIEAARGMGMTKSAVLFRIELPLAVPIILAGIRTALIINVGTATLGTFIGAGGLGESINNAIRLDRTVVLVTASGVTAIVALFVDWLAGVGSKGGLDVWGVLRKGTRSDFGSIELNAS